MKGKKGWIKIVEAVTAILLITGVLLISINKGYIVKEDVSSKVYSAQISILREIEISDELRNKVLFSPSPLEESDPLFPQEIKEIITKRKPNYLDCEAKICEMDELCELSRYIEKDIYAQAVGIMATVDRYSPKQLKLFCWIG